MTLRISSTIAIVAALALATPAAALALVHGPSAVGSAASAPTAAQAGGLLLTARQLGTGWKVRARAPKHVPSIGCGALGVKLRGRAARPVAAASPSFEGSSTGPFMAETAYVYATPSVAREVWRAVARHALLKCLSRGVANGSTHSVKFVVAKTDGIPAPHLRGVTAAAFRVRASATDDSQTVDAYADTVLLRDGPEICDLSFSDLVTPPPHALELRADRAVAAEMRSGANANGGR